MPKSDLSIGDGEYAPVADRIRLFYERYPMGRIVTHLVRRTEVDVMFRAEVFRFDGDREPAATGWASEREGDGDVNTVACLENTETSAVGRALANLGLTASRQRPSLEEMEKANRARARRHATERTVAERPVVRRTVAEPPPARAVRGAGIDVELQRRADRATEIMALLRSAVRHGLSVGKMSILRHQLLREGAGPDTLARVDRRVREWLERRFDRAARLR